WSTGKDSALALYPMLMDDTFNVDLLLTTLNTDTDRVSMHGVRRDLLLTQADYIGIPLSIVELPGVVSMQMYDQLMASAMSEKKQQGYTHAGFGDIFLEDLKNYRTEKLKSIGLEAHFPLWKMDSYELM